MSINISKDLNDLKYDLGFREYFIKLINNIINFNLFTDPLNEYVEKISVSLALASSLPEDTLFLPSVHFYNKSQFLEFEYMEFIKNIQKKKMRELWDNEEDEEWEYV